MRKNPSKQTIPAAPGSERSSLNKENVHPLQAHYQQYLLQQQQQQQKFSLNSNNFHSSDMSLSQSSAKQTPSHYQKVGVHEIFSQSSSVLSGAGPSTGKVTNRKKGQEASGLQHQSSISSSRCSYKETPSFKKKASVTTGQPKPLYQQHNQGPTQNQQAKRGCGQPSPYKYSHQRKQSSSLSSSVATGNKGPSCSGSSSVNTSSAQMQQQFKQTNKHLRFDSVQSSSQLNPQHHQILSIASQNYQALITGAAEFLGEDEDEDNEEEEEVKDKESSAEMSTGQKRKITLNNSLLECVDQYGNDIQSSEEPKEPRQDHENHQAVQEFDYIDEEEDECSSKQEQISELNQHFSNNPSIMNTASKNLIGSRGLIEIEYPRFGGAVHNFVACSPSAKTDDNDCQYTNSSAVKSMVMTSPSRKSGAHGSSHRGIRKAAKFISTDEKREEDLSSQLIDEEDQQLQQDSIDVSPSPKRHNPRGGHSSSHTSRIKSQRQHRQQLSTDEKHAQPFQEQFTGDDEDDEEDDDFEEEEIESKLRIATSSSQLKLQQTSQVISSSKRGQVGIATDYSPVPPNFTPMQDLKSTSQQKRSRSRFVEILDTDKHSMAKGILHLEDPHLNDTPHVMEMIDSSTKPMAQQEGGLQGSGMAEASPEMLGSRQNRRCRKAKQLDDPTGTRNSSRYLNFKDISPLVKSCNTFVFENAALNSGTNQSALIELGSGGLIGKISPPFLQNHHYPSVVQPPTKSHNLLAHKAAEFNTFNQQQNTFSGGPLNTSTGQAQPFLFNQNTEVTLRGGMNPTATVGATNPLAELISPESKVSSLLESPPPIIDPTPDKGIKDFNRKYLNAGMWPSKQGLSQGSITPSNAAIREYKQSQTHRHQQQQQQQHHSQLNKTYETNQSDKLKYSLSISSKLEGLNSSSSAANIYTAGTNAKGKPFIPPLAFNSAIGSPTSAGGKHYGLNDLSTLSAQAPSGSQRMTTYPNLDLNIVQKINTTIDNSGIQFYFKRPSDHCGLGNSSLSQLRTSRDREQHSISNVLNSHLYQQHHQQQHPQMLGTLQLNTLANNTIVNQSSFDDICNIHDTQQQQQQTQQQMTMQQQTSMLPPQGSQPPLTARSNMSQTRSRFSNVSSTCKECQFEKEKRNVTQKAFERALGISLFLMEEIDKINLKSGQGGVQQQQQRVSNASQQDGLMISKDEILQLLKQSNNFPSGIAATTASASASASAYYDSYATRFNRSKSQNVMPPELVNLQRSLQIPRNGAGLRNLGPSSGNPNACTLFFNSSGSVSNNISYM